MGTVPNCDGLSDDVSADAGSFLGRPVSAHEHVHGSETWRTQPGEHRALLAEINSTLAGAEEVEPVLGGILAQLIDRECLSHAWIYRLDGAANELQRVAGGGPNGHTLDTVPLTENTLAAWAVQQKQPVYVPQVEIDPRCQIVEPGASSEYAIPLVTNRRVLGVLDVLAEEPDGIRMGTRTLLDEVATQAAWALERVELHKQLRGAEARWKQTEAERASLEQQLIQAQKMEALGTLAGGIAHDCNNLLSVMLGFASLARHRLPADDPLQESMGMIEQSALRAAELTRQLLAFARPERQEAKPTCVGEALDRVSRVATRTFDRSIRVRLERGSDSLWVKSEPSQLEQALLNLCINARDAMPAGGMLALECSAITLDASRPELPAGTPPGRYVCIAVQDTGIGIEPEVLSKIFEPFFTTKEPGRGTGLGLTMVDTFVKNHDGFVSVESQPGKGTRFTLHLPLLPSPSPDTDTPAARRVPSGSGTVLIVDDEPMVRAFVEKGLEALGYKVWVAESGPQALEIYRQHGHAISCVLLDLIMPEMGGIETFRRLRELDGKVRVVFASGYSTGGALRDAPESREAEFIGKPYTLERLSAVLRHAATPGTGVRPA